MDPLRAIAANLAALAHTGFSAEELTPPRAARTPARKTGTITLHLCFCRLQEQTMEFSLTMNLAVFPFGRHQFRREQQHRLEAAKRCQARDPRVDVQVVTMDDGVCRVVARRLGGWACTQGCRNLTLVGAEGERALASGGGLGHSLRSGESSAGPATAPASHLAPMALPMAGAASPDQTAGDGAEAGRGADAPSPAGGSAVSGDRPHAQQEGSEP